MEGLHRKLREKLLTQHRSGPEQTERLRGRFADADAEIVRGRRNLSRAEETLTF